MIIECIYNSGFKWFDLIPIVISVFALTIAFYSWLTNSEPVIAFVWDNENKYYYLKNVGKGPAMNLTVTYINDTESKEWKNPVKCYSLEANGRINIDWGLKKGGLLYSNQRDTGDPSEYLGGVTKIAAVYNSANFLCNITYTSIFDDENTYINKGNKIRKWKTNELFRIWDLKRKSEVNK